MSRQLRFWVLVVVLLVSAFLVVSCGGSTTTTSGQTSTEPIKIGVVVGLTGFMSYDAPDCLKGVQLRLEEANNQVAGRPIELIVEDNASDPVVAVEKTKKLVEVDKVDVVLGPLFSAAAVGMEDYLKTSKTPFITFVQYSRDILDPVAKNMYIWGTLKVSGYYLGEYAYDTLGYRSATIMHADDAAGEDYTQGFIQAFEGKGGTIVNRQRIPADAMDFAPYLSNMGAADCSVFWLHGNGVASFLTSYAQYGATAPLLIPYNGPASEPALAQAGDASLGMIGCTDYTPLLDNALNTAFVAAFTAKYDYATRPESARGYAACDMFLKAVEKTGGDVSHDAINAAMKDMKFDTPMGKLAFTPDGQMIGNAYIVKVVKQGERYTWEPIFSNTEVTLEEPAQ
jgi:branched-chain amino acid transport system substrate-binding protein